MLSNEVVKLEKENAALREALETLSRKMESNEVLKPRSCQYCKSYVQHYIRNWGACREEYSPINAGHCMRLVPAGKRKSKNPAPGDTCPYFELGTSEMKAI